MHTYACLLHAHVYMKYVYEYNWATNVGPMYTYAYLSPETLIRVFYFCFFVSLL